MTVLYQGFSALAVNAVKSVQRERVIWHPASSNCKFKSKNISIASPISKEDFCLQLDFFFFLFLPSDYRNLESPGGERKVINTFSI